MIEVGAITSFRGKYAFLSNHYTAPFEWRGSQWFNVEQAFQFSKTLFPRYGESLRCSDLGKRLKDTGDPKTAKRYGREVPIDVKEWDNNKVEYMREIVHAKFSTPGLDLAGRLIQTGARMLIEGNDWGDQFWGRTYSGGRWTGLNVLGVILMEERGYWLRS